MQHLLAGLCESPDFTRWFARRLGLPEDCHIATPGVEAEGEFGDLVALSPGGKLLGWIQLHISKGWRSTKGKRRQVYGVPVYGVGLAKAKGGDLSLEEIALYLEGAYCVLDDEGQRAATELRELVARLLE